MRISYCAGQLEPLKELITKDGTQMLRNKGYSCNAQILRRGCRECYMIVFGQGSIEREWLLLISRTH